MRTGRERKKKKRRRRRRWGKREREKEREEEEEKGKEYRTFVSSPPALSFPPSPPLFFYVVLLELGGPQKRGREGVEEETRRGEERKAYGGVISIFIRGIIFLVFQNSFKKKPSEKGEEENTDLQ